MKYERLPLRVYSQCIKLKNKLPQVSKLSQNSSVAWDFDPRGILTRKSKCNY